VIENIKAKVYKLLSISSQRQDHDNTMRRRSYRELNPVEYANKDLIKREREKF
jgi:hypothetical protein